MMLLGPFNFRRLSQAALGLFLILFARPAQNPQIAFANVLINQDQPIDTDINPEDVIIWEGLTANISAAGMVEVQLRLFTKQDFTLYLDKVKFHAPDGYHLIEQKNPPTKKILDPISQEKVDVYYGGEFTLLFEKETTKKNEIDAKISQLPLSITFTGCTKVICLFPHTTYLKIPAAYTDLSHLVVEKKLQPQSTPSAVIEEAPASISDFEQNLANLLNDQSLPFSVVLLLVLLGGVLTNLTPCVYPMIPITLRLLANQGKKPIYGASAYAFGIFVTYTLLGVFASFSGSMFGQTAGGPIFNSIVAILMFLMALGMVGFGNLSYLQNLGNKVGVGKPSIKNAFLMGTGAGLVASPCAGPVLGFLLFYAASQADSYSSVLLLATYSFGFALPYVLLGSAASKVSKVKIGPNVQILVKLIFASVIAALGFYYLRIPFYALLDTYFIDKWTELTQLSLAIGLSMTVVIFIAPALRMKKGFHLAQSFILGFGIFSFTQMLSVVPPSVDWVKNEDKAWKLSQEKNAPILIDSWAEWCVACKKMDVTTFKDPRVVKHIKDNNWVLLKLDLTYINDRTEELQEKYHIGNLPTLLLIRPPSSGQDQHQRIKNADRVLSYVTGNELLRRLEKIDTN